MSQKLISSELHHKSEATTTTMSNKHQCQRLIHSQKWIKQIYLCIALRRSEHTMSCSVFVTSNFFCWAYSYIPSSYRMVCIYKIGRTLHQFNDINCCINTFASSILNDNDQQQTMTMLMKCSHAHHRKHFWKLVQKSGIEIRWFALNSYQQIDSQCDAVLISLEAKSLFYFGLSGKISSSWIHLSFVLFRFR